MNTCELIKEYINNNLSKEIKML